MRLPRGRNDRALLGAAGYATVLGLLVASNYVLEWRNMDAQAFAAPAAAQTQTAQPREYKAVPARGPLPLAHTVAKLEEKNGVVSVVRDPTDLPPPVGKRAPRRVKVSFETTEVVGKLADGTTYRYWTFNNKVPGPFVRVRVGDTVEVRLKNDGDSTMMHNVDFHAVTGPGGGAKATDAGPGESRGFEFTALNPGLYVYHCAVPMAAQHIANGMYGLILVEPEGGLPKVDHEYYVMQGELYTEQKFGTKGEATESYDKLMDERPEYFIFNGAVGALVKDKPLNDVQTISVPPGGAAVVDFKVEVPGKYMLVDHALTRVERGLVGILEVTGPNNPDVFKDYDPAKSAQSMSH